MNWLVIGALAFCAVVWAAIMAYVVWWQLWIGKRDSNFASAADTYTMMTKKKTASVISVQIGLLPKIKNAVNGIITMALKTMRHVSHSEVMGHVLLWHETSNGIDRQEFYNLLMDASKLAPSSLLSCGLAAKEIKRIAALPSMISEEEWKQYIMPLHGRVS